MPTMTHKQYADSLRLVADWFEAHPEIAIPHDADEIGLYNIHTRAQMEAAARAFGACKKEYTDSGLFKLKKQLGEISLTAVASRDQVCTRKVVGSRFVPEQVIPARNEDIVEWECFETSVLSTARAPQLPAPAAEPIPIDAPLAQAIRHEQQLEREADADGI